MAGHSHSIVRRPAPLLAALAGILALAWPGTATGTVRVQEPHGANASKAGVAAHIARVSRYWTPERMRNARPLDRRGAGKLGIDDVFGPSAAMLSAAPFAGASYARVSDSTVPPFAVNGRIFLRQGGRPGYCSGTAIDSPTRQLVLTAGHCVNSGPVDGTRFNFWSQYMEFVPAFSGGQAPFGAFVAQRGKVFALAPWARRGNPNFDVGAFLVYPNAAAQNVADAVGGGVGIALNTSRKQQFQTFGYPNKSRFLQQCDSPFVGSDRNTYRLGGKPTMSIRCRWRPGASGGGWLVNDGTAINGLTSYGLRSDRVHTFGPYFSGATVGRLVAGL
jgi:V8-like Glu-specific endopeptidase